MESVRIEAAHHDGGSSAERHHHRPEHGSEPPEKAVPYHVSRADQCRLTKVQDDPAGEIAPWNHKMTGRGMAA